jgi:DNA-binding transcriptional LysR family regulator
MVVWLGATNVRHLAVFRAVMKTGSVSAAARVLNVSQPAVTKTLQLIEARLRVKLFQRVKGRLQPTAEGVLLLPGVDQIFGAMGDVDRLAQEIAGGSVGHISLATNATLSASITATAIARHRVKRPNVTFAVQALSTRQAVEEVTNSQVDLAVIDNVTDKGHHSSRVLCRAYIGCVIPSRHRLARKKAVTPNDLAKEPLITFSENTVVGVLLRENFRRLAIPINVAMTTNHSLMACVAVRNGAGVALLDPFLILSGLFPDLVVRPLQPPIELRPGIIFPTDRPLSVAAREFMDSIQDVVDELLPTSSLLASAPGS